MCRAASHDMGEMLWQQVASVYPLFTSSVIGPLTHRWGLRSAFYPVREPHWQRARPAIGSWVHSPLMATGVAGVSEVCDLGCWWAPQEPTACWAPALPVAFTVLCLRPRLLKFLFCLTFLLDWFNSHQDPSPARHSHPLDENLICWVFSSQPILFLENHSCFWNLPWITIFPEC